MTVFTFFKMQWPIMKYLLMFGIILIFLGELIGRFGAYFGSRLINLISTDPADRYMVIQSALILIFMSVLMLSLRAVIINLQQYFDRKYIPYLTQKILQQLFKQVHQQSVHYFEQEMSGNLTSKINNVIFQFEVIYSSGFWSLLYPFLSVVSVIVCVLWVNWQIGLILLVVVIVFHWAMYVSAKQIVPVNREVAKLLSLSNGALVDSITNIEISKSFGQSYYEKKHLFSYLKPATKAEKKRFLKLRLIFARQAFSRVGIQTFFALLPLLYWYYDKLSFADYIFIQSVVLSMTYHTGHVMDLTTRVLGNCAVLQEALDVLYQPIDLQDKPDAKEMAVSNGLIEIQHVTFGYDKKQPVFKDFSLTIRPKEKIGLVGYSGSGKSSLIKLISRYYDVSDGQILIDGQNIADVKQESLRGNIAYIMQEPALFNRTVIENIRYARPSATEEEVIEAAKKAYCHDFIMRLPNGYQSKVGERGVMLSGGERQRIAIARAILKDAPILILDEATSALDSESEYFIQKSLEELMKEKTVIAIAHRLATLKKMSRVIVLENGQITESGTHAELMRNKKLYYRFYEMQSTVFIGGV